VHCIDCRPEAGSDFLDAQARAAADTDSVGSLHYAQVDVRDVPELEATMARIASQKARLDGLIAAAGIQRVEPALEYSQAHMREMMDVNYGGVMFAATAAARQMIACGTPGNIMLVASMSGKIANKGLISPVYNSSKAAVIQLGKNLAMEWAQAGIRVNSLCPGHIVTPMVQKNFEDEPHLEALWARENMMGRLSSPEEFKGAALFLLSDASSFMTGSELVIDGGHTAW
jgi:NAD(P)-dependent dehydrogenase (short-subunit alcohol dehydrogenase family)